MQATEDRKNTDALGHQEVLNTLAKLGGKYINDDDLTFEGTKFVIPEKLDLSGAVKFLKKRLDADEEEHNITRSFQYRPYDVAYATWLAMKEMFGAVVGQATYSFFGKNPPEFISIDTAYGQQEQIPWSWVSVPLLDGEAKIYIGSMSDREKGELGQLTYNGPRKHRYVIEGLFAVVEEKLRTHSIYKGKAINGREDRPEFLQTHKIDHSSVVYSQEVLDQLAANVWSVIEHTEQTKALGLPLKRAVLLEGPYGTGKTLASTMTADKAVENNWTFILCRPGRDDLVKTMQTAALYSPAVVFFEDVDVVAQGESSDKDSVSELLDVFDGMGSKSSQVMAIMTTNHVSKIHRGMLRPGRLDAVISIGHLDDAGIRKLCIATVPRKLKGEGKAQRVADEWAESINWDDVCKAMDGFLPAFVAEACTRAVRYTIARGEQDIVIVTEDLVRAATGLRPQLDLMNGAGEGKQRPSVDAAISEVVTSTVEELVLTSEGGDRHLGGGANWALLGPKHKLRA